MIMDYEKLYKEALERAKEFVCIDNIEVAEYIFPELKESEDERIRKCIKLCLEECVHSDIIRDYEKDECLAWLEKQREQKWHVEDAMKELEEKAEAFTAAHQGENADEILAQMRGEKNSTWSEEDEKILGILIEGFEDYSEHDREWWKGLKVKECTKWLKSLKPHNTWKPSEEQMITLLSEVKAWTKGCPKQKVLESLYNDLMKLYGTDRQIRFSSGDREVL